MNHGAAWKKRIVTAYWSVVSISAALMFSATPVFAANDSIWTSISSAVKDIYGQILGISTLVGVTAAAIALIVRMISRNQRAVDESTAWLKRIIITWLILNTLGFIIAYLQGFVQGGQWSG